MLDCDVRILSSLLLLAIGAAYLWVALHLSAGRIDWALAPAAVPALVALALLGGWGWTRFIGTGVALVALATASLAPSWRAKAKACATRAWRW